MRIHYLVLACFVLTCRHQAPEKKVDTNISAAEIQRVGPTLRTGAFKIGNVDSIDFSNYYVVTLYDSVDERVYLISAKTTPEQEYPSTFRRYEPLLAGKKYRLNLRPIDTIPNFATYFRRPGSNVTVVLDSAIIWSTDSSLGQRSKASMRELYTSTDIYGRYVRLE